jgi:23S rRNA (pseudouridine1915-N3)-methyltransferase
LGLKDFDVVEVRESRAESAERRMLEESIAIANVIPDRAVTVILDERGESLSSASIAGHLQEWRLETRPAAVFIIGAADGLAPTLRDKTNLALAFGAATWPHQLVRIMLFEQLYRAVTILSGHPYHRS